MVVKNIITNRKKIPVEIAIEPDAEYITLLPGQQVVLEFTTKKEDQIHDIDIDNDTLIVYREFDMTLKVFINGQLLYESD